MKYQPADWNTYTSQQRKEWYSKPYEESRQIILQSYMNMIVDENGDLDKFKILELILELQDRVDYLEETCERSNSYYE